MKPSEASVTVVFKAKPCPACGDYVDPFYTGADCVGCTHNLREAELVSGLAVRVGSLFMDWDNPESSGGFIPWWGPGDSVDGGVEVGAVRLMTKERCCAVGLPVEVECPECGAGWEEDVER